MTIFFPSSTSSQILPTHVINIHWIFKIILKYAFKSWWWFKLYLNCFKDQYQDLLAFFTFVALNLSVKSSILQTAYHITVFSYFSSSLRWLKRLFCTWRHREIVTLSRSHAAISLEQRAFKSLCCLVFLVIKDATVGL